MVISCSTCQKEEKECTWVKYLIYAVLSQFQICRNLGVFFCQICIPKILSSQKNVFFLVLLWISTRHSLVQRHFLAQESNPTNTPFAPSRTHRSQKEYYQPLGPATKPLNRQNCRDFIKKECFSWPIRIFHMPLWSAHPLMRNQLGSL